MSPADYEFLCRFLLDCSGLSLGTNKEYLVESRLVPLAQSWGLADVSDLVAELRHRRCEQLRQAVVEAMTTNETSFYRDKKPFEDLRTIILPALIERRRSTRRLRIWSAAASTGQEPYSIAMLLAEHFPHLDDWSVEILGTDIDTGALETAARATYSQFEVQRGLSIQSLMKHFEQDSGRWRVKEPLRRRVTWKQLNLLHGFRGLGTFDVIFCRNVLIYFETATKERLLRQLRENLTDDGYLLLGAAETVMGLCAEFDRSRECSSAAYRPVARSQTTAAC